MVVDGFSDDSNPGHLSDASQMFQLHYLERCYFHQDGTVSSISWLFFLDHFSNFLALFCI